MNEYTSPERIAGPPPTQEISATIADGRAARILNDERKPNGGTERTDTAPALSPSYRPVA